MNKLSFACPNCNAEVGFLCEHLNLGGLVFGCRNCEAQWDAAGEPMDFEEGLWFDIAE